MFEIIYVGFLCLIAVTGAIMISRGWPRDSKMLRQMSLKKIFTVLLGFALVAIGVLALFNF